jgi:D-alanine--poly(phosphoribitol) ligase subunit 1
MSTGYHHDLGSAFLALALSQPDAPAIRIAPGEDVSYGELAQRVQRLSHRLAAFGIGCGDVVALQNGKTCDGYAAMLACLTIGAAYVNLDDQNPPERLVRTLDVCRPRLILCDGAVADSVREAAARGEWPVVELAEWRAELAALPSTPFAPARPISGDRAAYLMFTSGSTGIPKGVTISHASVLNFIAWSRATFAIGPGDVVGNVNPIYFDNSVFDVYSALFTGACLAPVPRAVTTDARALVALVDALGCTIWFSVPSLLIYLMTMKVLSRETFTAIRAIVFGGEGFPKPALAKLFALYGGRARLVNVYGPTECTCICSAYEIGADDLGGSGLPPLGHIAANFDYRILDGDDAVAPGETGELCLMGPQLGLGYYNDSDRTAAAFVLDDASPGQLPRRMYRCGDLVREEGGLLWFVGRKDHQIKHMGYRIELEEVEAALSGLTSVVQAAVVYHRVREAFGHIVAYVAAPACGEAELREELRRLLPDYMIPNRFVLLPDLPTNANGKIDRVRLKELAATASP